MKNTNFHFQFNVIGDRLPRKRAHVDNFINIIIQLSIELGQWI